jgi:hypothetical protein
MWTSLADVVRTFGTAGMAGLTLVAVMVIQYSAKKPETQKFATYSLLAALFVFCLSLLVPRSVLQAPTGQQPNPNEIVARPVDVARSSVFWVDTGISADWGGGDIASTTGPIAKYTVKSMTLCDESLVGRVATCWDNRPHGYPGLPPTASDITGTPPDWCAYKEASIMLGSPPTGRAKAGRVYVCARAVKP